MLDDDPLQLQVLDLLLRAEGIVAECFDQPQSALLRAAGCTGPLSVLMDLNLPSHDPAAFCDQLRAASPAARLVGVSASVPTLSLAGLFDALLLKPVEGRPLAEAVCLLHESPNPVALSDSTFASLAQHMTTAQLDSLYTTYFADTSSRFAALEAAIAQGDHDAYQHAAHALKGSSSMLGLQSVAACMTRMEALVNDALLTPGSSQAMALLASARHRNEEARLLLASRLRQLAAAPIALPATSTYSTAPLSNVSSIASAASIRPIASSTAEDQRAKTP